MSKKAPPPTANAVCDKPYVDKAIEDLLQAHLDFLEQQKGSASGVP